MASRLVVDVLRLIASDVSVDSTAVRMETRFGANGEAKVPVRIYTFDFELRVNDRIYSAYTASNRTEDETILHRFDARDVTLEQMFGHGHADVRKRLSGLVSDHEQLILALARSFGAPVSSEVRSTVD